VKLEKNKIIVFLLCITSIVSMAFLYSDDITDRKFHSEKELAAMRKILNINTPIDTNEYFLNSANCRGCHGYDLATTNPHNVDEGGNDVNLVDRWESSMMAMSAKDPYWRAKVRQEILVNPSHSGAIQNTCTKCHAPMGNYTSMFHGNTFYGLANLANDSLGSDGVSCSGCHTIGANGLGTMFSGNIPYDTTHKEYGPFQNPSVAQMQLYEGFTPIYSTHMDDSKLCSPCHTLVINSVDLNGNPTGNEYFEQTTYQEYVNSNFKANNIKCQTCHMPQINDAIIIANGASGLTPRTPFNQHSFEGANYFMLNLIKNNKDSLGVNVPNISFDRTIAATEKSLKQKSVDFKLFVDSVTNDTIFVRVKLKNKAGHKFPSAYPSRRAVLQVVVTKGNDTVFASGIFNSQQRVIGENSQFEPHHNIINQNNKPQIYETIPGDVTGNFTSILERAAILLKDNRLPPDGFSTTSLTYDTVKISNDALADEDFNKIGNTEGTATDYVHYHIPISNVDGAINIKAKLYYQAIPPKWLDEMFALNATEINKFKGMYNTADKQPFLMVSDSAQNIILHQGINELTNELVNIFPSITNDGIITISCKNYYSKLGKIEVFNSAGKLVIVRENSQRSTTVELPEQAGIYFFKIKIGNNSVYKKVIRVR